MASNPANTAAAAANVALAMSGRQAPSGAFHTAKPVRPDERSRAGSQSTGDEDDPYGEIGTSGLRQYGGFVLEEWLSQLQGRRAAWVYREMMDNSPIIGAVLFAIEWMARRIEWAVEPGNDPKAAEFVEQCMNDMEQSWGDFITEALSMLPYGYSFHEQVYKLRKGRQRPAPLADDGSATEEDTSWPASSKYDDGKIGWRSLPGRAQETLLRWQFDGYSRVSAFVQIDWHGGYHVIPISKGLLFRSRPRRNNPEGYSVLRPAYVPYFRLKNIEQIEAIGVERDLAGIPVATPPDGVDLSLPMFSQVKSDVQKMVTSIRRDEFEGIVMPSFGWKLELLASSGSRQIDTDAIIRRYETTIATTMLADFLKLGQDSVGSFALASVKSDLFAMALDGLMDLICEVLNGDAISDLLELNGFDISEPPTITHTSATQMDLETVGQFLYQLSGAGADIPWTTPLLKALFDEAGLPSNFEEAVKEPVPQVDPPEGEEPVGAPKLPFGQDPFAREAHYEPTANQPPPVAPATAPVDPKAKPVKKADPVTIPEGTVHDLSGVLLQHQNGLASQLEVEINSALAELGVLAASAYSHVAVKAGSPELKNLVRRIMSRVGLRQWIENRLQPVIENHSARVMADTQRLVKAEIGLVTHITQEDAQKITAAGGTGLGLRDIEPQVRAAIMDAISKGQAAGEHPTKVARRIRDQVPAGRFTHAGPGYRSKLIARTETAEMMRASTLAAYRSNPRIDHIQISDGILADSDADCIARNGQIVPIDDADSIQQLHPNCTLSLNPVVASTARVPELAAA